MNCYILVPGLSEKYRSGGLMVARDIAKLLGAKFIATHESHPDAIVSTDLFKNPTTYFLQPTSYFIVTWGPLVSEHIKLIRRHAPNARILYYAQSFGWNIKVPPHVPIVCVSRYVMSQWALRLQENFIAYVPPPLNPVFRCENKMRDIDILVHTRKQNEYCLKKLLPALQAASYLPTGQAGKLQAITNWISQSEFAFLLNRTKIFLYLTGTHRAGIFRKLPAEGFGLPALEALACGALVGSNLLGGVTDFLTPGENCIKLQNGNLGFDLKQIKTALENFRVDEEATKKLINTYQPDDVTEKWKNLLSIL